MDMNSIMEQARQMQQKMAQAQEDLAKRTVSASAGGGMVTVTMNGRKEVLSISIEKVVVNPDEVVMLQDLIVAAVNEASRKAQQMAQEELSHLTGGLKIPGLF
jgi:DNA-binding YbaB/EbfC family protein